MKQIYILLILLFVCGCTGSDSPAIKVGVQSDKPLPVNLEKSATIPVELNIPEKFPVHIELNEGETLPVNITVPANQSLPVKVEIQRPIFLLIAILSALILILAVVVCAAAISIANNSRATREFIEEMKNQKKN